jgi:hypothetical protein
MSTNNARRSTYLGVMLVSLATLAFELLLTRIFSVTLWNSYAFVAVSLAMFGMTAGAVLVHVRPDIFRHDQTSRHMSAGSLLMAFTTIAAFEAHRAIRIPPNLSLDALPLLAITYLIASIPFVCSGVVISLALTRFPPQVSRLYAADLCGASVGCILLGFILTASDGPTAVYATAAIASFAAIAFAVDARNVTLKRISTLAALASTAFVLLNTFQIQTGHPSLVRIAWAKNADEPPPLYERWNSYSRVRVYGDPETPRTPIGWGFSSSMPPQTPIRSLWLDIDASAATSLTNFNGDFNKLDYLPWDVTNIAHQIKTSSDVLIIGSGGGRDILSSLYFHEKSITGVEMNNSVYAAMTQTFGDFIGHLDRYPNVRIINDEARSYLARSTDKFDLIQLSLVDTWAATAAGAFVLSENALYTTQAWDIYLSHLRPGGIISVSRWYAQDRPWELQRLAALAAQSLRLHGATRPQDHIAIICNTNPSDPNAALVATLLASVDPLTPQELSLLNAAATQRGFQILFSPTQCRDPLLATVIQSPDLAAATANLPVNLLPPTDDKPFFFDNSRLSGFFRSDLWNRTRVQGALLILLGLFAVVLLFSAIFILAPLAIRSTKSGRRNLPQLRPTLYFTFIGIAFLIIEITQMQRLVVLLGHPAYSLTVVLFALLVSSGIGSFSTKNITETNLFSAARSRMIALLATLVILGIVSAGTVESFQSASTPLRIAIALALLFPAGFFMGMAFPIGMKWAARADADYTAWLWAVNGAASVCASVLAMILSMTLGITAAWWCGVATYLAAAAVLLIPRRSTVALNKFDEKNPQQASLTENLAA